MPFAKHPHCHLTPTVFVHPKPTFFVVPSARGGGPRCLRNLRWHGGKCRLEPTFLSLQSVSRGVPPPGDAIPNDAEMPRYLSAGQEKEARQDNVE